MPSYCPCLPGKLQIVIFLFLSGRNRLCVTGVESVTAVSPFFHPSDSWKIARKILAVPGAEAWT
jgi:hypothetical protein